MQGSVSNKNTGTGDRSAVGSLSNSASPAPGLGRPMRGTVRGYDARTGMGKIKGDDGATYSFFTPGVLGGVTLQPGQTVEFTDNDGVASKISVAGGSSPSSASNVGGLANSSSPAPGPGRSMRGIVRGYDARTGMGKIKGEDGATYSFFTPGVLGGVTLQTCQTVEFTDNDGVASKISVAGGSSSSSASNVGGLANSSSPAPGLGRPMRGIVHVFDPRAGMGKIKGEDGASYRFFSAGIVGGRNVRVGKKVEFTDNDGVATKITLVRGRLSRLLFG